MIYLLIFISILLDDLLIYFIPSYFNHLTLFYPMFTLTLIIFLYKKVENKKYFKLVFMIGFIYDLLFSYLFLFNSLIFFMFGKMMKKIDKFIQCNLVVNLTLVVFFIFLYDFILFGLVSISKYNLVTFSDFLYKFKSSLLLNLGFYLFLYLIFKDGKVLKNEKKVFRGKF